VIRSDEIRKWLCGVEPLHRLGSEGYASGVSERVYATVTERAEVVVRGGHAAIVDAVFARPSDREAIERAAAAAGVPFVGLWLDAAESELVARSERRVLDASDADAAVIRSQIAQGAGSMAWHRLDASSPPEDVLQKATLVLAERLKGGTIRSDSRAA
jgi:predicted kinase